MDPALAAAYARCRALHRRHGRSYYLATRLLPSGKRPHVHALYGFTRYADEIVDRADGTSPAERARRLREWSDRFLSGLAGERVDDPLLPAVLHTIDVFDMDRADFATFLASMAMDLEVREYGGYDDLLSYMEGSAAAIGTMMLPILEPADRALAREPARQLGLAFQLTNFIRDVGEDLDRGRLYLPKADLDLFGVTRADLRAAADLRASSPAVKALIAYEVKRAREHYAAAAPGVPMLAPTSQACIRAAFHLYGGILDEVRRAGHDVFARRAVVPKRRRLATAVRCVLTPPGTPVGLAAGRP
ncbi:phytoene/squalene synthase family protein [Phytohabitans kaempferiae]|uniref:Phytoene/squalene synthase family protein n=1 Tax=Phytohabitans kaempferiae TaxID=1620943 RepID=A0ABV6LYD5_9ACTN